MKHTHSFTPFQLSCATSDMIFNFFLWRSVFSQNNRCKEKMSYVPKYKQSKGEGCDPINRFNPATFVCLPKSVPGFLTSHVVVFLCSAGSVQRRLLVLLILVELMTSLLSLSIIVLLICKR